MSAYTPKDPALADHLAWLGYVQPEGLVVSAPALVDAQAIIDRAQLGDLQRKFSEHVTSLRLADSDTAETAPGIENLQKLLADFLGWPYDLLVGVDPSRPLPNQLYIALPEFQETLRPSFAVKNPHAKEGASPWLLLVQSHPPTVDLDKPTAANSHNWHASPAKKFERLLRETGVPIGLLTNGTQFRLIYAPPKENSGALTFPVGAMSEVSGRLILGAFQLLLGSWTLFTAPSDARLPALLQRSRDYQASVSEILAEQVLHALYELLRGFEAADERVKGALLRELAAKDPANIYGGLVTVLLRLVFTLFAEDRGLLPMSGLYVRHYSVRGLFERLRADAERYPDTMDHRFGAWAQLLALFRVIHGGCKHPDLAMPARAGHLFDPDRYPFLEGRRSAREPLFTSPSPPAAGGEGRGEVGSAASQPSTLNSQLPLVSDGTIYRILEKLCILEGERVSYRTLDVEEIGSVYQTIMGFGVETATGTAIGLKGKRKNGGVPASPVIYLEALLAVPAKDRAKWLKENADSELTGEADKKLKAAATVDDLLVALEKRIDRNATPGPVAKGGLVLQPGDERRRSGSHYTPRSFTEPIVRKTLEPILRRLAEEAANGEAGRGGANQPASPFPNPSSQLRSTYGNDQQLSRPESLAGRPGTDRADLSGDSKISSGGAIRTDLTNAAGSGVDSLEHRGGLVAPASSGIPSVSPGITGQSGRTGDASAPQPGLGTDAGGFSLGASQSVRLVEPTASSLGTSAPSLNAEGKSQEGMGKGAIPSSPVPLPSSLLNLKICDIAVGSAAFLVETCRQLADVLVKAWRVHGGRPALPPDETEELLAMRLIAQRCLYGVDRNPMATDLAKLSLWLATLAKDHPFTFLDHSIRCGDSLVGLTRQQIEDFTWRDTRTSLRHFFSDEVRKRTAAALRERQNLLGLGDDYGTPQLKRERLEKADELLDLVRFIGDAALAAFFAADKDKAREAKRVELADRISEYLRTMDLKLRPTAEVNALRGGQFPVAPFHWEIEFPEVFDRENPGFDAIVGNPPFAGHVTFSESSRAAYTEFLRLVFAETGGKCDAVAFFFRTAFERVRNRGCFGLIATNTIGQGATRQSGLRWICTHGGTIYLARRRHKWPGQAAVIVSIVNVTKDITPGPFDLDGREVPVITAYLFHAGGHENPATLESNEKKSFMGSVVVGLGFTFDDEDSKGRASSIADMNRLITSNPANNQRIFPYIGGDELNNIPTHVPSRYVINFGDMSEAEARRGWPDLMQILETKVKPERMRSAEDGVAAKLKRAEKWWQFSALAKDLYEAAESMPRVLACGQTSKYRTVTFLQTRMVFDQKLIVFRFASDSAFAVMQSRFHEAWAIFFGSTMKDDPVYTPTDCFETFPFPAGFETNAALEAAGREYYEFRAALMVRHNEGLTKTYNRFHDPEETNPDILKLRELHAQMDAAVLTAYGWTDLLPQCRCEFLLDYEDEDSESGAEESTGRKKKKPWRYRWPDEVRDEVLARLLKLNAERAEQERLAGQAAAAAAPAKPKKARSKKSDGATTQGDLLPSPQRDLFG